MAEGYKLWQVCPQCLGEGEAVGIVGSGPSITCFRCNGEKYIFFGWCSADLFTLPANLPEPE